MMSLIFLFFILQIISMFELFNFLMAISSSSDSLLMGGVKYFVQSGSSLAICSRIFYFALTILQVGVTFLLIHVTNESHKVLEVISAELGEQGTSLLELDAGHIGLSI